jgi:1,2-diacylglycerol 3-alpha-glucosyltransferase
MRIGLFTDTYRPSINGIVYVIDSLREQLEAAGHEVFIFCPGRKSKVADNDRNVIILKSVKGIFFDDYDTSIFLSKLELRRTKALKLDVIHFFTPGQIGMLAMYVGHKQGIPVVAQHSTDLYQYVEHYPAVLPGLLALIAMLPLKVKIKGKDAKQLAKLYMPRRSATKWNRAIVETSLSVLYSKMAAVIVLSRKSQEQLMSWQKSTGYKFNSVLMPNGVDPLPKPKTSDIKAFKRYWNIAETDKVVGFVGRLGAEKNLDVLIPSELLGSIQI